MSHLAVTSEGGQSSHLEPIPMTTDQIQGLCTDGSCGSQDNQTARLVGIVPGRPIRQGTFTLDRQTGLHAFIHHCQLTHRPPLSCSPSSPKAGNEISGMSRSILGRSWLSREFR